MGMISMCTSRTILGFLGLLFLVSGLTCIIIGGAVVNNHIETLKMIDNKLDLIQTPAILLIFVGVIFLIAGISGCCNLFNESKFFIFLFVVVSMMITSIVLGSVYRDEVTHTLRQSLNKTFMAYNQSGMDRIGIDAMQQYFKCCGINGSDDWLQTPFGHIPDSCYFNSSDATAGKPAKHYEEGCYLKIKQFLDSNFDKIIIGTILLLLILVLGMSGSCALFWYKKNDNYFTLS